MNIAIPNEIVLPCRRATRAQTATTTTGAVPAEAKSSTVSKDEMFSSKLKGLSITNQENSTVGEIAEIAIKNDKVDAFILSVAELRIDQPR